ncbi:MAG TPA: nuclear transport factor 2 family protein [Stellaceae bacterium]|nr:nuclear transport factor 2 family protein [Stellaceae bacterium]
MSRHLLALLLLTAAPAWAAESARNVAQEAANKAMVLTFYDALFNQHDLAAIDRDIGKTYIQHNPMAADGPGTIKALFGPYFKAHPGYHATIARAAAEGDLVFLHVHAQEDSLDRGRAVVDIFRIEGSKIVEHWDVVQPVPEKTASGHPMF